MPPFPPHLFDRPVTELAQALIGVTLLVEDVGGVIVETEAYRADEPAAHSFRGPTPRTAAMFGPPGRAYVYRSYGLHWCLNIVGGDAPGSAVLIRALEPTHGVERMAMRRRTGEARLLCAGPGRVGEALGITAELNCRALDAWPFDLHDREAAPELLIGPRIGISKATDLPWRFGLAGSRFLSRPFSTAQAGAPASRAPPIGRSSPRE